MERNNSIDASPNPEYLIKSIAEQGYSLETSLADLMDNSISANADKIEILIDFDTEPFRLFLVDNGLGMDEKQLTRNMMFPSRSPEGNQSIQDLGRFGLGLKTASFSQTRRFSVLSRKKGEEQFHARTWDVDFLKENGWKILINSKEEINELLKKYHLLTHQYLNQFENYIPNTIIVWEGLYKFENYLNKENRKKALKKELTEITSDHLSLVFHRFLERKNNPLKIRINNSIVKPFNPFPDKIKDFRKLEPKQSFFKSDVIKIEGFILPSRSIKESNEGISLWTTKFKGLMDMEGLYIYRSNRIILFGGWNGIIKKAPRLQLARLRVEVGNSVDHQLHLNVAKSQISIPHELRKAFEEYIAELTSEAEREFFNRGIRKFSGNKSHENTQLFDRSYSNKGPVLEINQNFPLIKIFKESLTSYQISQLNILLRMLNNRVNQIRKVHEERDFLGIEENDGISISDLENNIVELRSKGVSTTLIKEQILPHLGFKYSSLPDEIKNLLK